MRKRKRCNKHGYYRNDVCPGCLSAIAPDLLEALKQISDIEDARFTHAGFDLEVNNIAKAAIAKVS